MRLTAGHLADCMSSTGLRLHHSRLEYWLVSLGFIFFLSPWILAQNSSTGKTCRCSLTGWQWLVAGFGLFVVTHLN